MTPRVTIVDYGVGNLLSIRRALAKVGADVELTGDLDQVARAERLLLPGVGAFGACAQALRDAGLVEPITAFAQSGNPFLGICVGMQLLFETSHEFGTHPGLGLIPGYVDLIPAGGDDGATTRKVPHIGWAPLLLPESRATWAGTALEKLKPGLAATYFVHSYNALPTSDEHRLADADYAGFRISAAVQRDNVTGVQFHPEKSGDIGLAILASFSGVG